MAAFLELESAIRGSGCGDWLDHAPTIQPSVATSIALVILLFSLDARGVKIR
jgi:hypothetical protein